MIASGTQRRRHFTRSQVCNALPLFLGMDVVARSGPLPVALRCFNRSGKLPKDPGCVIKPPLRVFTGARCSSLQLRFSPKTREKKKRRNRSSIFLPSEKEFNFNGEPPPLLLLTFTNRVCGSRVGSVIQCGPNCFWFHLFFLRSRTTCRLRPINQFLV